MLLKINADNPNKNKISQAIQCLKNDGVIIFPTDSVYAFGCDLYNKKAVERICQIKGIKPDKANFSIICYDLSNISYFAIAISKPVFKMLKRNLPGPFTFILHASRHVPKIFDNKKRTIGIRIPDNEITRSIVNELNNPIIITSLRSGNEPGEYMTDPEMIHQKFNKLVDIVIDGGIGNDIPSTIIDCTGEEPDIIREGIGILET